MKAKTAQDAFIEQTCGSIEKAREADRLIEEQEAIGNKQASLVDICKAAGHSFGQGMRDGLNIPTNNPAIKPNNSQYKSCFKNYDFSADMPRPKIKSVDDGVEWGELHDDSIGNWEIDK